MSGIAGGLRTILRGGEGAGKKTIDCTVCTVIQSFNFGSVEYFSRNIFVNLLSDV